MKDSVGTEEELLSVGEEEEEAKGAEDKGRRKPNPYLPQQEVNEYTLNWTVQHVYKQCGSEQQKKVERGCIWGTGI